MADIGKAARIDCYQGEVALSRLLSPLTAAGLLPAPVPEMEPEYLAAGFEGENPAALVASNEFGPVAYMPFIIRPGSVRLKLGRMTVAKFPCRQLRLFGVSSRDRTGPDVLQGLLAHLLDRFRWDVADLADFPTDNGFYEYLSNGRDSSGLRLWAKNKVYEPLYIDIEGSYESYLKKNFGSKTRFNLKRNRRRLEEHAPGKVVLRIYTLVDQVGDFLRDAGRIAVQTYQWQRGLPTVTDTPAMRQSISFQAERGWFRGYILFVDEQPGAYCYGFIYKRTFLYKIVGYDPDYQRFSPGTVLLCMILEDLFATGLAKQLDFGITSADYKEVFYTSKREIFYSRLYPPGRYARLLSGLEGAWEFARSRAVGLARRTPILRRRVPKPNFTGR
jgi:CelD/BcsL family acetyltransferase involved in cellulose biosynthesis